VAAGAPDGQRFPRARRLTAGSEIREVLRQGKRSGTAHLDVFDSASPFSRLRLGLIVPRHGHSAVERNLLKRRLREIIRRELIPRLQRAGVDLDIILRARRTAYGVPYGELRKELIQWTDRRWSRAP
jgi:ribonuclease P protein component